MALALFTSTSVSTTTTKSTTKSPTATGEMADDIYFLLVTRPSHQFTTTIHGKTFADVQPVTCQRVDFETWRTAGRKHATKAKLHGAGQVIRWADLVRWHQETWVGRRINDEVEMFEEGMGEEYAELRKDLERAGLSARPYVSSPEVAATKFPSASYKAVTGGGENTLMASCMRTLGKYIASINDGDGVQVGLIADLPSRRAKALAILRVPDDMMDDDTVLVNSLDEEVVVKVLGRIRDGDIKFGVADEEVKRYFDSLGNFPKGARVRFLDVKGEMERREKEAARKRKKEAKKHRRNATASTIAAGSLGSETSATLTGDTPSLDGEGLDEEDRKANKREKAKNKLRAQAEKRRTIAAEEKRVVKSVVELIKQQEEEDKNTAAEEEQEGEKKENEEDGDITYITLANQGRVMMLLSPKKHNTSNLDHDANTIEPVGHETSTHDPTNNKIDDDRFSSLSDSSFSSTIDEEDAEGLEVLHCNSREDIRKAMEERPGRNIVVAYPEEGVGLGVEMDGGVGGEKEL